MNKQTFTKNRAIVTILLVLIVGLPTIFFAGYYSALGAYPSGATPVFEHPISDYSYLIWNDGGTYYAKNGSVGTIDFSGTNATQIIINSLDALGQDGGKIFVKAGTYTLTTSLTYVLDEAIDTPYPIEIVGEGESTVFQYEGTGYAINITTDYQTYEYVLLANFKIDGVSKTSGRHGLAISGIGRNVYVEKLYVANMDYGIHTYDTNTVFLNQLKVVGCNTGIRAENATSSPNAIYITNSKISDNTDYGVHIVDSANVFGIDNTVFETNGEAVYIYGSWNVKVDNSYFEANTVGINISSIGGNYVTYNVKIENSYFRNNTDYAIKLYSVTNIEIDNIKSRGHNNATIYLHGNSVQSLLIINPSIYHPVVGSDPYLLDGSPTTVLGRLSGQVITERWQGVIAMATNTMTVGTVAYWSAGGVVANATSANQTTASVIGFAPRAANSPCVVVTSGIAQVYVLNGENIAVGDALTSSATSGQASETADETPWIYVIGYAVEADVDGADLVYTRIAP